MTATTTSYDNGPFLIRTVFQLDEFLLEGKPSARMQRFHHLASNPIQWKNGVAQDKGSFPRYGPLKTARGRRILIKPSKGADKAAK